MATNFPTSLDAYADVANGPGNTIFAAHVNDPHDAIEAIEAKVGIGASTPIANAVFAGTAAGVTSWSTGPTLSGTLTITAVAALSLTASAAGIEMGATGAANTPFIDFHSSGNNIDYDARLVASGGTGAVGQGSLRVVGTGGFNPDISDGVALGTSSNMWSDLFLASGAVINFNNGDVTLTHGLNAVTFAGGDLSVADNGGLIIGGTSQVTVGGFANELQVLGTGEADSRLTMGRFSADAGGPRLVFIKSRGAIGGFVTDLSGDEIALIDFLADDGADYGTDATRSASIEAYLTGTVAGDRLPGELRFRTATNAAPSVLTTAMTISNAQLVTLAAGLTVTGNALTNDGVRVGADSTNNEIDDASQGAASTTLYIGNASINVTSDQRHKTNILDTQWDPVGALSALRVRDFIWADPSDTASVNRNSRGRWVGLIAQEAVDVVPWAINAPDRGCPICRAGQPCGRHEGFWHIEYEHLVALSILGWQNHEQRIVAMEVELRQLQGAR